MGHGEGVGVMMRNKDPDYQFYEFQVWWEERIIRYMNKYMLHATYYRFNPDNLTVLTTNNVWVPLSWSVHHKREFKDAYAQWVMEKELGL